MRGLVLAHLNVPGFVDYHEKPYTFGGVKGGGLEGWYRGKRGRRGGRESCSWYVQWIKNFLKVLFNRETLWDSNIILNSQYSNTKKNKVNANFLDCLSIYLPTNLSIHSSNYLSMHIWFCLPCASVKCMSMCVISSQKCVSYSLEQPLTYLIWVLWTESWSYARRILEYFKYWNIFLEKG